MVAVLHGHDMVVREILSHSPDKAKTVELEGRIHSVSGDLVDKVTALWCALDRAHFPIARTLIDLGGANINHGPLHSLLIDASSRGRLDIVHFLIENGYADVNQTTINDENTALAVAAMEGHLELVKLLCIVGVSSSSRNHAKKTPIMLAAENNKLDVVNFLLEHNHNNATFNDLELSVALHILSHKDTENFRSEWVMKILRHSLTKRTELKIPKVTAEPIIVYNFQQESQSIDDLDQIQDHDDGLYTEALLIQERTLLPQKDERLLTSLFERATIFVEKGQFDQCIDLMVHILHLSQQFEHPIDFKQFFWLFYNMFNSKLPIPINRFWEACDIIFKPSQKNSNDYQMRDQSYLLAAIAKMDPPEISLILRELKLNEDSIANIYSHGSWAQGTCTPKSDRDLIIVTRLNQQPLQFQSDFDYFHSFELHKLFDKYDVCVYSIENFEKALEKNYLFCVQCLFLPDEFRIKEEIDFRTTYLNKFYDPVRIKQVAFYEMFSSFNMLDSTENPNYPKRSSDANETSQARKDFIFKNLFHGIRFLDIAEQLIQTQSVYNFIRVAHILNTMKVIRNDSTEDLGVVEFVRRESSKFKCILDVLIPRNIIIKGTFEVHITFDYKSNSEQVIEKLKRKCENTKYEIAFLHFYPDEKKNKIQQLITILSYHGEYPSIIEQIQKEVYEYFQDFNIRDIKIKSLASNEGIPTVDIDKKLFWDEKIYYFEFNYRIFLKQEHDEKLFEMIQNTCKSSSKFNSYLSTYVIKKINHRKFHYMIKMCLSYVGRENAFKMDDAFVEYLQKTLRSPSKIEREFIVYDTNIEP